jgi:hypothetical protein
MAVSEKAGHSSLLCSSRKRLWLVLWKMGDAVKIKIPLIFTFPCVLVCVRVQSCEMLVLHFIQCNSMQHIKRILQC